MIVNQVMMTCDMISESIASMIQVKWSKMLRFLPFHDANGADDGHQDGVPESSEVIEGEPRFASYAPSSISSSGSGTKSWSVFRWDTRHGLFLFVFSGLNND